MEIRKVGIVGSGIMGSGIAEISARAGYKVQLCDINRELLQKGLSTIKNSLMEAVKRGRIKEEEKSTALEKIGSSTEMKDFADCDLVIEAVTENLDAKKNVFRELDNICPVHTIMATNTSCLSVIDIASATGRQDRVLGLHFFNPVTMMKLVELVKTIAADEATVLTVKAFAEKLGKTVVIAPDTPGFIVNRILAAMLLESMRLLESGQVTKEDLDRAIRLGLNHPVGPLSLSDLIGLDTELFICEGLYDEFKDDRFAPPVLLKKMVAAGLLGRKSGKGFFNYNR
jgi:3-hydroxybutyryl-CoA dehydrogenase